MNKMKFYKILLVFIGLILIFISGVDAQEKISPRISVAPHTFEIDVFPGEIIDEKIKVYNQSEVVIPVSARITGFEAENETGAMIFDETSQDISISASKWIKIENPKFILEPNKKRDIEFQIKVPENAEPGGHFAVALFEATFPSFYFKEGQPKVVPSVGVLFLLSVKTFTLEPVLKEEQIEVVEFLIPKEQRMNNLEGIITALFDMIPGAIAADINIVEKTPSNFVLRIKNNDIFHHKLEGKILVQNFFGKKIGESKIRKTTILPGKIREFPIEFEPETSTRLAWLPDFLSNFLIENTFLGSYKVVLGLEEQKTGLLVNQSISFFAFPWKIILIFLFFISLLFSGRKRIKLAAKSLIKP